MHNNQQINELLNNILLFIVLESKNVYTLANTIGRKQIVQFFLKYDRQNMTEEDCKKMNVS